MAEFYSTQVASAKISLKSGSKVVLAVEHCFEKYYQSGFTDGLGSLELSGLNRFIIKANNKPTSGPTTQVKANLPVKDISRVYILSEQLLKNDFFASGEKKEMAIYSPPDKYFSDTNDKGERLCYSISVMYNPENRMPVQVEIKNYWAALKSMPGGTTQIVKSQSHDEKAVKMWLSLNDWFDMIVHIKNLWDEYATASFTPRLTRSYNPAPAKK